MREMGAGLGARAGHMAGELGAWLHGHVLQWYVLEQGCVVALGLVALRLGWRPVALRLRARALASRNAHLARAGAALAMAAGWVVLSLAYGIAARVLEAGREPAAPLHLAASLTLAWGVIVLISGAVQDARVARLVAVLAWTVAALNIVRLLDPAMALLDRMSVTVGTLRLSVLLACKAAVVLCVALWVASLLSRLAEARLRAFGSISPAMQVLASKLLRAGLLTIAVLLALGTVGINLTAFAVFSGAIGVGVGFGLQKVVSNLISGVILLMDRSIKPGDVIELAGTYGWITQLNARYASIVTRDGTEHLIPNEDLITQRVVNWTYSNDRVRLRVPIGISYRADLGQARAVCVQAAASVGRVLGDPAPICLVHGFGDSTIDLELRFWIGDPRGGVANVKSDVLMAVWERFRDAAIELPFPQRDLHIIGPVDLRKTVDDGA